MPLKHGTSSEVVGSNIKEMMKSGRPRNQSIAAALSMKRKSKKMAKGGEVADNGNDPHNPIGYPSGASWARGGTIGDMIHYPKGKSMANGGMVGSSEEFDDNEDPMTPHKGHGAPRTMPDSESMSEMSKEDPEDYDTSLNENRMNSYSRVPENDVENPAEMDEAGMFARALRRKAGMVMSNVEEPGYAMGGLVQPEHDPDEGNKPSEEMEQMTEEPMSSMPYKPDGLEHKMMGDPSGPALSKEALEAIERKRKSRRYPTNNGSR